MARGKNTIRREVLRLAKKSIDPADAESFGTGGGKINVLRAIALAQFKKGLEGDLRAAEFIERQINAEEDTETETEPFEVLLRVVGSENEN